VLIDEEALSHPASLFAAVASCSGLLLAVSGGPVSLALLRLAAAWRDSAATPPRLAAATVDHGLRPEAATEAVKVAEWSRALGVPHRILVWGGPKPVTAMQEQARLARYRLLFDHMREVEAKALVTAHHADDQWETVMMRLSRGSGISGLVGMSSDHDLLGGRLVRPLLHVSKARLIAYCRRHGQEFFDDPSNSDPQFARSRWRELAAPLHGLGLTPERAGKLSERAEKCDRALKWAATRFLADVEISSETNVYDLSRAQDTPQAILEYFLQGVIAGIAGTPASRLERLENLASRLGCALRAGTELRATLGGCAVVLDSGGRLSIGLEPKRNRGV
jgi:tRNA(Ile)-lysidine synthase